MGACTLTMCEVLNACQPVQPGLPERIAQFSHLKEEAHRVAASAVTKFILNRDWTLMTQLSYDPGMHRHTAPVTCLFMIPRRHSPLRLVLGRRAWTWVAAFGKLWGLLVASLVDFRVQHENTPHKRYEYTQSDHLGHPAKSSNKVHASNII